MANPNDKVWSVYILECNGGTWYTGMTSDIAKRVKAHNTGRGSKYTRSRMPVRLMEFRTGITKSEAFKLEAYVKKQKKEDKIFALFDSSGPIHEKAHTF